MNRNKRLVAVMPLLFATYLLYAQGAGLTPTLYDMSYFNNTELNGTARYVGMGGAMNALGGDISLMGTNPAGIGLYRKNDVAVTGGIAVFNNDMGALGKEKETRGTFNQAGFVYSNHVDGPVLKYFNMGFNYHKLNNFNGKTRWNGVMPAFDDNTRTTSLTTLMAEQANGYGNGAVKLDVYDKIIGANSGNDFYQNYTDIGWLTIMGMRTGLVTTLTDNNGNILTDKNGDPIYGGYDGGTGNYYSETRGGIDSYDFNMSFNLNDRVYLGVTLGAFDVNYEYYSSYSEDLFDPYSETPNTSVGSFVLENWKKTTGNGFNLNLGAIFRPIEDSPFRFGVAFKTPTWFRLTDTYSSSLSSRLANTGDKGNTAVTDRNEQTGLTYDYRYQTPWSFNLSVGHTVGNFLAFDAEYEYTDYSKAKLRDADGNEGDENQYIKAQMKALNMFKIGLEWKAAPDFAIRFGYNYLSSVMKTGYDYEPGYNSVNTRTDYANMKDGYNLTFGMGYSGKHFYADFAYLYSCRNYDFNPFVLGGVDNQGKYILMQPTALKAERHQAMVTVGYRF